MKLGLYFDLRNPENSGADWPDLYERALGLCERAEEWGADSAWLSEHHAFRDGYLPQPLTFAAAIAARTRRIRIGTAIMLAPLRNAPQLAEEAAVVDLISNGRLDLGLGGGYRAAEFELYGADHDRPLGQLFERVAQLRDLWSNGPTTPAPLQSPPPLWLGCNGPRGAYRTGLVGERLLSADPRLVEPYLRGLAESGADASSAAMAGPVNIFLSDKPERDRLQVMNAYAYLWNTYNLAAIERTGKEAIPPVDIGKSMKRGLGGGMLGLLVATPENAAEQIAKHFANTPVKTIFTWSMLPGVPTDLMDRHVELWCTTMGSLLANV